MFLITLIVELPIYRAQAGVGPQGSDELSTTVLHCRGRWLFLNKAHCTGLLIFPVGFWLALLTACCISSFFKVSNSLLLLFCLKFLQLVQLLNVIIDVVIENVFALVARLEEVGICRISPLTTFAGAAISLSKVILRLTVEMLS